MLNRIKFTILIITALLAIVASVQAVETQRGMKRIVAIKDTEGNQVGLYTESHALVIGISRYTNGWPSLPGVKKDVVAVKDILETQGFNVQLVQDPKHQELRQAFMDFIDQYGRQPENRLLFYFSGHGHTLQLAYGGDMGYIVPSDSPNPNRDGDGFKRTALDMEQIEVYAKRIESKHALFLFDSCFSGSIFSLSRAVPENITYKTSKPVRQFITSGSADETVPDESIFCSQFISALEGESDLNKDGYVTGVELGEFLQGTVVNYSKGSQHPQYGKIKHPRLDKGDFVFETLAVGLRPATIAALNLPSGARVFINGDRVNLPYEISPGTHAIRLERQGYETIELFRELEPKQALALRPQWVPVQPELAFVSAPNLPSGARVFINGDRVNLPYEISPGTHVIRLERQGYETIELFENLESEQAFALRPQWVPIQPELAFVSAPNLPGGTHVMINGSPITLPHRISSGKHVIRLERQGFQPIEISQRLEPAQVFNLRPDWIPLDKPVVGRKAGIPRGSAFAASLFLPGLGQHLQGRSGRGLLYQVATIGAGVATLWARNRHQQTLKDYRDLKAQLQDNAPKQIELTSELATIIKDQEEVYKEIESARTLVLATQVALGVVWGINTLDAGITKRLPSRMAVKSQPGLDAGRILVCLSF